MTKRFISESRFNNARMSVFEQLPQPNTFRTFNIATNEFTEWEVVPDNDPRAETIQDKDS